MTKEGKLFMAKIINHEAREYRLAGTRSLVLQIINQQS
jgi:hypothetical protein